MSEALKEKPRFTVKAEGDFTNWALASFPGIGNGNEKISAEHKHTKENGVEVERTYVRNISNGDVVLVHVGSALISDIGEYDNGRYAIYICKCGWQGEMQWQEYTCRGLGIYDASNHLNTSAAKISFNGSQTTSEYYPMIMIKDNKKGVTHFFETEPLSGWYFEIGISEGSLYVEANSAFICNDGWQKILKPGDEYISGETISGCVSGGLSDAVRLLNDFKRERWSKRAVSPMVIFNDYMNCLWANPDYAKLLPLIDAAADAGCEVFCIDDGWYEAGRAGDHLGDWTPCDSRFEPLGFKGITDCIKRRNMIPGVWLEMESCSSESDVYKELNDCLLTRNGVIIGGSRAFLDFRKEKVREYTMRAVERLYELGVRYIKNDYNHNLTVGCDGGDSLSEGYARHRAAFLSFIDELREKFPELIIESCSSGAMRADFYFLRHTDLQSVSDQEYYYNNPSIIAGALSCIPPERCGFWSYPYPLKYEDREKDIDGIIINGSCEETVFNMINSMLGVMVLSGHIDKCDSKNAALIAEAVSVYKKYRADLSSSSPVYITKPLKIGESGAMAAGLKTDGGTLMAVWKINSGEMLVTLDIDKDLGKNVKLIYPLSLSTDFRFKDGTLDIVMKDYNCARLFWISD